MILRLTDAETNAATTPGKKTLKAAFIKENSIIYSDFSVP